jgi:lysophospholipase L1-like esterase
MKRFAYIILAAIATLVSCTNLDEVWAELRDHEERIQKLETLCNRLNSNVEAIQTILTAMEQNDYVTDIVKVMEDGVEVGYSITFAKGGTVTIYHGTDGVDGSAPKVSIRKAQDGEYYWTADGEWVTDENGEMIPAVVADDPNGEYVTPQFRVADGKWYVSYDNGNTWRAIDQKNDGENFFQNVTYDQDYVYITLADGNIFKIPYKTDSKVVDLFIFMGQSNMSGFGGDATLAPEVPEGWAYEYKAISNPDRLVHLQEPFGLNEDNAQSGVSNTKRAGTLVSAFANAYYEKTRIPIIGVSCSRGSTDTEFWKPGGKPLEDAIKRHLAAEKWLKDNGYSVRNNYMIWLQGESDAALSAGQYKSNLIAITKEMICRTGISNCMIIRIGKKNPADNSFNNVLQAQTELPREYKEFVLASTLAAGFPEEGLMSDGVHYNQEGYNLLGSDAGINAAFYANNGIEPYMYDPHYDNLYYPTTSYKSIFDIPDIEPEIPQGTVYYELNKNINADDELVDYPGRIAILDYFETNGQAINVTSSITSTFGKRYYNEDKQINGTYSNYTNSTYSRIVCVLNETGEELPPNAYDGETITINGKTYILQQKAELEELSYWKTYLDEKINEINHLSQTYGDDADCFIYIADQHRPTGAGNEAEIINYIVDKTTIRNVIFGGDIVQGSNDDVNILKDYIASFNENVNILPMRGNHEVWGNLSESEFWDIGIKPLEGYASISDKLYFYYDNPVQKIRYIITDSTYSSSDGSDNLTSSDQIKWMQNKILELDQTWTVLVFHHGIWTASKTAEMTINNDGQLMIDSLESIYDQADCTIAGLYAAHCHRDHNQISEKGLLLVGTTLDCCAYGQSSYDIYNPNRTKGTISEHAFDVVFFIPKESKIRTIRIGAGNDRTLSYSDEDNSNEVYSVDITSQFVWTPGTCTWSTGRVQSTDTYWLYSNPVDISEFSSLTFTHCQTVTVGTTLGYCFYDASMNHIVGASNTGVSYVPMEKTIAVPSGACYFRCMWMNTTSPHYTSENDIDNFYCFGNTATQSNRFAGKTAYFFGDSITYGYTKNAEGTAIRASNGGYPGVFSKAVGLTHTNYGVSGSLFGTYNDLGRIGDKIKSKSLDCDFMFVAGGINDWQCGVSLSDFRQAVEDVCAYISSNYDGEVMFITPINHSGRVPIEEPVAEVQDYRDIITEIALKYDFSVIQGNLFDFPTENSSEEYKTLMFCDNLHPTEYGYEFYAECMIEVLL